MALPLIFEYDRPDLKCGYVPKDDLPKDVARLPKEWRRGELPLPQVAEPEVLRHFINLSTLNHHVDKGFYPLGSCTMKYNPKVNEVLASLPGFAGVHPHQPPETIQGALALIWNLERYLGEISGFPHFTLQPNAGAHGELTAMFMTRAYHTANGNPRKVVLSPDSSHGTNPASIVMAGYKPASVASNSRGRIDLKALKETLNEDVAAIMITNPNTVGLFEDNIREIAAMVHDVGALMYMDGANLNALMGLARPADMGFDMTHINLHKTFSTPHGGGGPGAGPVGVVEKLKPFLPIPRVVRKDDGRFDWQDDCPQSIGKVGGFAGPFGVLVRAAAYIRALGPDGLKRASEMAILNANYIRRKLEDKYKLDYKDHPMHEVVFSADWQGAHGIKAVDIAKRLLDFDMHAPTINFPLIIHEALMIEPTETETVERLDRFIEIMRQIDDEARENPEVLREAPHYTHVTRLNEAQAARNLDIVYQEK